MPGWAEWAARPFSWLGGWVGLTVTGVVVALVLGLIPRRPLDVAFLLLAGAGVGVLTAVLKGVFERPRPELGSAVPLPGSYGFPSGHASGSVALLGALALVAAERLPRRRPRLAVIAGAVLLAAAIGASRVVLNVHYVSDVAGGFCLGVAWLGACVLARREWRRRARLPREASPARGGDPRRAAPP